MVLAAGRDSKSGRYWTKDEYSVRTLSEQSQASFFPAGRDRSGWELESQAAGTDKKLITWRNIIAILGGVRRIHISFFVWLSGNIPGA